MGHGAGGELQSMVLDMRNRFFVALGFSLPIFAFSPMGFDAIKVPVPFGLRLDLVSRRSDYDGLIQSENGQRLWGDEQLDAAGDTGLLVDQAHLVECLDHLVN